MGYRLLADAILVTHVLFVAFVVVGLVLIWLGGALRWRWVHARAFRIIHLGCIAYVAIQAVLGEVCPLTIWESQLREAAGQEGYGNYGFIAYYASSILFYDAPTWVFTACYVAFALLVLASFWVVPVRWRKQRSRTSSASRCTR